MEEEGNKIPTRGQNQRRRKKGTNQNKIQHKFSNLTSSVVSVFLLIYLIVVIMLFVILYSAMSQENNLFSSNPLFYTLTMIFLFLVILTTLFYENRYGIKINKRIKALWPIWLIIIFLIINIPLSINNYYRVTNTHIYHSPYFTLDEKKYSWDNDVEKIVFSITSGQDDVYKDYKGGINYQLHFKDGKWVELNVNVNRSLKDNISLNGLRRIDEIAQSYHIPIEYNLGSSYLKVDDLKDSEIKDFIIELLSR